VLILIIADQILSVVLKNTTDVYVDS